MTPQPASPASRFRDHIGVGVILSGGALVAFIFTAIAPVLSAIGVHFGGGNVGDFVAQLVMTMPAIGIIAGAPLVGILVERFGPRAVLIGALIAFAAFGCVGLAVEDSWSLFVSRLLIGVAGAGISTSTTALVGSRYTGAIRSRMLGYWSSIGAVGGVVSILIGGALGEAGGWHTPFILYAVGLPAALLASMSLRAVEAASQKPEPAAEGSVADLIRLWPIYLLMIPLYIGTFMTGVQLSFLVADNGINSPSAQSWIISMGSVGSAAGAFMFGLIEPRIGRPWTFVLFVGLLGAASLVMGGAHDPVLTGLGAALNGMGGGLANPYFAGLILDRAPLAVRGRALGFMYTIWFGGEFINPLVITPLRAAWNLHGAFIVVGAVLSVMAIIALLRKGGPLRPVEAV